MPVSRYPPLESLLGTKVASSELSNDLVDLIYCYVVCYRRFGGDPADSDVMGEFVSAAVSMSAVLSAGARFSSVEDALATLVPRACALPGLPITTNQAISALSDVADVLESPRAVAGVLADLHRLIEMHRATLRPRSKADRVTEAGSNIKAGLKAVDMLQPSYSSIKAAGKKVWFFGTWWSNTRDTMGPSLASMKATTEVVLSRQKSEISQVQAGSKALKEMWCGNRPPKRSGIEELN